MNEEVQTLFRARDEAVRKQDGAQFLSTQLRELAFGTTESYLSIDHMTTEILYVQEESEDDLVVFVKETYASHKKIPRSSFLIYFLIKTYKGWKIYRSR